MTLVITEDGSVSGTFYESDIEAGRASASNGRVCFAFRTTDGVGPYHTSGCLVGERILGETWAQHRKLCSTGAQAGSSPLLKPRRPRPRSAGTIAIPPQSADQGESP